jgi:hypothetical protein
MRLTEYSVSSVEEKHIVTGLIVSTEYCKNIKEWIDFEYFKNSYLKILAQWSLSFFEEHSKAPFKHINDIFESFRHTLKEADSALIDDLLTTLSSSYTGDDINVDFLVNEAEEYFRTRELEIHINNISVLKDKGDLEQAEQEISRFNRISIKLDDNIYINPGDEKTRDRIYRKRDELQSNFLKLPGDIGIFIGNIKPGDCVGITAPQKRGKSFLITDFQKHAVMSNIQCLKWSIEMTDVEELERHDKIFFPSVDHNPGYYTYPEFDCMHNQIGDCGERNSSVIVRENEKSNLVENAEHVICTKCKENPLEYTRFLPTTYKVEIYREENSIFNIRKAMKRWLKQLDKYSRIVVRPKYSLTYDLMMRDIDVMHSRYGFIPRLILLDYIDILKISSIYDDYKLEDEKWKLIQQIAGQTGCAFITPTQGNKASSDAKVIRSGDQAGFYGKSRHVNKMLAINQDKFEKKDGIWRLGMTDSRSSYQAEDDFCLVLQDLKAGQMHLESYWPNKFSTFSRRQ